MIKTVLLDDDINSLFAARVALSNYEDVRIVGEFTESADLVHFLKNNEAELLFLDIELSDEQGFDIAKRLEQIYPKLMIVFLTGHSSYAMDSFDFNPVYFLTKPIRPEKLKKTMELVLRRRGERPVPGQTKLMFKCPNGYEMVRLADVFYIERRSRKNILVSCNGELQIGLYTMYELSDLLKEYGFFRCHQSFLVALDKVSRIYEADRLSYFLKLKGCEDEIPVSRNCYRELLQLLQMNTVSRF